MRLWTYAKVTGDEVSVEQLLAAAGCVSLVLLTSITVLPVWITLTVAALMGLRLLLASRGRAAPAPVLRFVIATLAIGLLFLKFHTFNGLIPGTALLSLIAGLKLLETRGQRDLHVITMIVYFLSLATLLEGESFWLLIYLIAVCWLSTATLLRLADTDSMAARWQRRLRYAGKLLAQALPLALAFWLFFPRLDSPLWHLPDDGGGATIGLSDTMSPGDITDLAQSDEVAFRARFLGATPPADQLYWRGPVLQDFDGHTWSGAGAGADAELPITPKPAPRLLFSGTAYRYTVSLEPSAHRWLFALDWPAEWDTSKASQGEDYMLLAPNAPMQPIDLTATSYVHMRADGPLAPGLRRRDTTMPGGRNPRTRELAAQLHAEHPDTPGYVQAVLDLFRRESFYYTLTPPRLGQDSVDGFLFDSRRGFCGHFASAFATLMRAAGIPARVVTGYQGGTFNRFAGYWILRQSDAHAWDEVWLEGQGWMRVDPTASIPANRVEHGLNDIVSLGVPVTSRWQQRTHWLPDLRLELDALKQFWRQRILEFDQHSQERLLEWLHVPEPDGQKLALFLAGCLITGMLWLTWVVRRELDVKPSGKVERAYAMLCGRLGKAGLTRRPHEGAEDYAARVAASRPDLTLEVADLCRCYTALRYSLAPQSAQAKSAERAFIAAVRRFRPRAP